MAASVIVPVRKAVIAGIKTAVDDRKVLCSYGYEGFKDDSRREQIFTNRATASHDPASLKAGRNFREERMEFDVVVLILGVGKATEDTDARAMQLGRIVEEFVADHKNNELGVTGLQWIRMSRFELANSFNANGTITELTYTLTYSARLT